MRQLLCTGNSPWRSGSHMTQLQVQANVNSSLKQMLWLVSFSNFDLCCRVRSNRGTRLIQTTNAMVVHRLAPEALPVYRRKSRNLMPLNTYTIIKPGQKQPVSFCRKSSVELWRTGVILLGITRLNSRQPQPVLVKHQVTDWVFQRKGWEL